MTSQAPLSPPAPLTTSAATRSCFLLEHFFGSCKAFHHSLFKCCPFYFCLHLCADGDFLGFDLVAALQDWDEWDSLLLPLPGERGPHPGPAWGPHIWDSTRHTWGAHGVHWCWKSPTPHAVSQVEASTRPGTNTPVDMTCDT
jgi:hypothetical protein